MSVINPNETAKNWRANKRESAVQLYLTGFEGDSADLVETRVAGFALGLNVVPITEWIDPEELGYAVAAVIQVDFSTPSSIKRFHKLAQAVSTPLIAAAYDPPLALVRSLVRAGAHDVVPLPLNIEDLETSLGPLRDQLAEKARLAAAGQGKMVTVIKSVGGVGATALLTQLAMRRAEADRRVGREVCLIDLDVQFGDVAFQLGLHPRLTLADLLDAGSRLDGDLLRATMTEHVSGLKVLPAPAEMMPLEGLPTEHLMQIAELATREFDTVFVDLPTNWSNWSLSLVARSELVLLVTELTVAGLHRAKRQLKLLESQDLGGLDVRVLVNRYEKSMSRFIRPAEVREALGRDVAYSVTNDFPLMSAAIDRGVPLSEIKRKSALAKDLDTVALGIAAALGAES